MDERGATPAWGPPGSGAPAGQPIIAPTIPNAVSSPPVGVPDPLPAVAGPELSFEPVDPPRRRRSGMAVAGALVAVLALGGAGVFAVGQLRGNTGGAASPEDVGAAFMSALEQEDVLGMVDLLLPGERDVFRDPMLDVVSELKRLEVLSAEATLADLSGLDIEMTDESTSVTPTNVRDISNIVMSATLTATLDGDQLPIGDLVIDLLGDGFSPTDLDQPTTTEAFTLPMTVVEQDGRWFLSLFHTAAESVRGLLGESIPSEGVVAHGGDSPEGAIDAMLDGVEQFDLEKIIAAINPNEAAALQRYAPLFLDDVEPFVQDVPLDWQVTRAAYAVAGSGSKRFVTITALRIDGTVDASAFSVDLADGCLVVEAEGERFDTCDIAAMQDDVPGSFDDFFGGTLDIGELTAAFEAAFADYEQPGITVERVDGEWFVSPLGTGFDQFLALLRALDRGEVDRLIDVTTTFINDLQPDFGNMGFPGDVLIGEGGTDVFEFPDSSEEGSAGGAIDESDEFEAEQDAAMACYELDAVDDAITCLRNGVDAGLLSDYYVGVELLYPECGLAASSLGREPLFGLTDAEYTDMIATSAACFETLIAAGEVDRFDVPPEYLRPECGEGRNPWSFGGDDDDFFDRWTSCIYG